MGSSFANVEEITDGHGLYNAIKRVVRRRVSQTRLQAMKVHIKSPSMKIADVMKYLNMTKPSMTLKEAKEWIKSVWVAKAMQNVPVRPGLACNICQHCTSDKKLMGEHFSNKH